MVKLARIHLGLLVALMSVQTVGAKASRIEIGRKVHNDSAAEAALAEFASWPSDKVFLKVGDDVLLWGPVRDYIGFILKTKPLTLPPGTTWADVERAKRFNERKLAVTLAKRYMGTALMAQLARDEAVDISKSKLTATGVVEKIVSSFPDEFQKDFRASATGPGSYVSSCATNTLLSDAYVESVIRPSVSVTESEISEAIAERKADIEKVHQFNAALKARLAQLQADLRVGKIQFETVAEKYSQCVSSERKGYWGRFGEESSSLLPEIKTVAFSLPTNVVSEVVETPCSYHILKVTATPPEGLGGAEEDEDLDDFDEGEKTIHLSHIMIEKIAAPPLLDESSAREFVVSEKIKSRQSDLKCAALTNLDIYCAFPLKLNQGGKK